MEEIERQFQEFCGQNNFVEISRIVHFVPGKNYLVFYMITEDGVEFIEKTLGFSLKTKGQTVDKVAWKQFCEYIAKKYICCNR